MKSNKGFTLIELLVVVLIIGILAAIATPQYRKAVLNAKLTQNIIFIDALRKGADFYYLNNGIAPKSVEDLDIDITGSAVELGPSKKITSQSVVAAFFEDGTECITNSAAVACLNDDFYLDSYHPFFNPNNTGIYCCGRGEAQESICKAKSDGVESVFNSYLNCSEYKIK